MIEYKNGVVTLHEDAYGIKEVDSFYKSDKTGKKEYFKECITYLYWMYKKGGIYSQNLPRQARKIIKAQHLKNFDPDIMEKNKKFQELRDCYIEHQYSITERFWAKVKDDMQSLLDHIAAIPFQRIVKTNKEVEMEVDGESRWVKVKVDIPIDNSEEKAKAIMLSEKLINLEEKLSQKIKREDQEKKVADSKALFDTND